MSNPEIKPNYRILVIDDNVAIHEDFRKILSGAREKHSDLKEAEAALFGEPKAELPTINFEVDSAYQGQEGLDRVRQALADGTSYAMAFVDVRMPPGWDGIETIRHLWEANPELQVVICTAYSDFSWDEIRRLLGDSASLVILKKPFDNVEVLQLAHTLTKKWLLTLQSRIHTEELDWLVEERSHELREANVQLRKEIAERQQIEAALRLSEERFAKAFHASPIPLAIQALSDQHYVDVNESFICLSGYTREELLESAAGGVKVHADAELFAGLCAELRETKSIRNRECKMKTKADATREVLLSLEYLELGAEAHALVTVHDITEQLDLETQLRQTHKMEAVGQLAAGVAHDFNNLLTIIQGQTSQLMEETGLSQGTRDSLQEVLKAAERAASLTRQLLAFSRKQVLQIKVLNVNEVVRNLTNMLLQLIGEHITVRQELAAGPLHVQADVTHLEQVVLNLAVNARDAMPQGGRLLIKTAICHLDAHTAALNPEARPGDFVSVSVTDTGCGMTPEILKRVFEPFFTTKDVGKGTGLGLATVHGILKQHHGWIEGASQPGEGTTFTCYLPLSAAECSPAQVTATPPPQPKPAASGRPARILVVEDEEMLRDMICNILLRKGYYVASAENGNQALSVWDTDKGEFDLLLTDVLMPDGLSGPALARTLLTRNPHLKVLFTSGHASAEELSHHGAAFLPKPYSMAMLVQAVCNSLDGEPARGAMPKPEPSVRSSESQGRWCAGST